MNGHAKRTQGQRDGEEVFPNELFVYTHTLKHDSVTFVNNKAKETHEKVQNAIATMSQPVPGTDVVPEVDKHGAYIGVVGVNKGLVYGLGSMGASYCRTGSSFVGSSDSTNQNVLQRKVNDQAEKIYEQADRIHEQAEKIKEQYMKILEQTEEIKEQKLELREQAGKISAQDVKIDRIKNMLKLVLQGQTSRFDPNSFLV